MNIDPVILPIHYTMATLAIICDIGSVLPRIVTESFVKVAKRAWEHPIRNSVRPICLTPGWEPNINGGFATNMTPTNATGMDMYVAL